MDDLSKIYVELFNGKIVYSRRNSSIYVLALCISKIVKTAKNWTNTVADNKKKLIVYVAYAVSKYKSKC